MKKILSQIILLLVIVSCRNNSEVEDLKLQNEQLRNQLEETKTIDKKFVVAVIYHKRGTYVYSSSDNKTGFEGPIKDYVYYSDILETENVDETAKYKILDNLEDELRRGYDKSVHSIIRRECNVFNTYVEASKFLRTIRK